MADGRNSATVPQQSTPLWREIFRCFQIALDPRKLVVAAAGIVTMSAVWWLLSVIFFNLASKPDRNAELYSNARIQQELGDRLKPGTNEPYREDDLRRIGDERYQADQARWLILEELAGPGGRLRTMPWYEFRGENPLTFLTRLLSSSPATWGTQAAQYIQTAAPILLEPLAKLLLPVVKLASPGVSPLTRFYLILVLVSSILVWAFFAGIITRIAAIQYARKGPVSLRQAVLFVAKRYLGYAGGPLLPLGLIALAALGLIVFGLFGLIPLLGDVIIFGLGLPLILLAGVVMAFFAVGLVAYPLMFVTLSVEGDQSDALDAVSRSMNYLYQTPWRYLGYWSIAMLYGAAVTFFVLFFISLAVYLGKWAVSQAAAGIWSSRDPAYLFIYAPPSFGWRELLTADSPYAVRLETQTLEASKRTVFEYVPVNQEAYNQALASFYLYNYWGADLVGLWLTIVFLMMIGFSYSFFWTASTVIYFLLRKVNDEAELDEVYEEEQEEPFSAAPSAAASPTSGTAFSLPVTTETPSATSGATAFSSPSEAVASAVTTPAPTTAATAPADATTASHVSPAGINTEPPSVTTPESGTATPATTGTTAPTGAETRWNETPVRPLAPPVETATDRHEDGRIEPLPPQAPASDSGEIPSASGENPPAGS